MPDGAGSEPATHLLTRRALKAAHPELHGFRFSRFWESNSSRPLSFELADLLVVEIAAIVLRTWMWIMEPGIWYFPDSNVYIYAHQYPVYATSRPGAISTLWFSLTLGVFNQSAVGVLQLVAGLVAVAMVYDLLRRIAVRPAALIVSLGFALFPMVAVFERSVMSEALALDFLVAGFWALTVSLMSKTWWVRVLAMTASLGLFGIAAVVRSALVAPLIALSGLVGVAWFIREQRGRLEAWVVVRCVAALLVGGLLFVAPLEAQMNTSEASLGLRTLNPLTGSFLAARWTQIMPCSSATATQPSVERALKELCADTRYTTTFPGFSMNLVWDKRLAIGKTTIVNDHFAQVQEELKSIALGAMKGHPGFVARSMWGVVANELFTAPSIDAKDYNDGYKLFRWESYKQHPEVLEHFMETSSRPPKGTNRFLESLTTSTARWPQFLFWTLLAGLVFRMSWWWLDRRRSEPSAREKSAEQRRYEWGRWILVAGSWTFLVVYVLGVAASAYAVFRYNLMLMPSLLILLSCVWSYPADLDDGTVVEEPSDEVREPSLAQV